MRLLHENVNSDYTTFKCIVVVSALRYSGTIKNDVIDIISLKTQKFSPTNGYTNELINLLLKNGYINMDAKHAKIDLWGVDYNYLLYIKENDDTPELAEVLINKESIEKLWREINVWECIEILFYHLEELHLSFILSANLIEIIESLLEDFSLGQIYNISYSAIESALYQLRKGQLKEDNTFNYIKDVLVTKANRSLKLGYTYHNYDRPQKCSQSELSKYFFNKVIEVGDAGFNNIAFWEEQNSLNDKTLPPL